MLFAHTIVAILHAFRSRTCPVFPEEYTILRHRGVG